MPLSSASRSHKRLHTRIGDLKPPKGSKPRRQSFSTAEPASPPLSPILAKSSLASGSAASRSGLHHTASDEALELEAALKKLPTIKRRSSEGQAVRVNVPALARRPEKGRARATTLSSQSACEILAKVQESHSAITSDGSEDELSESDHEMSDDGDGIDSNGDWTVEPKARRGLVFPSHKDEPESEYPSPAETIDSPRHEPDFFVQDSTMAELESILANDPCHVASSSTGSIYAATSQQDQEEFHYQLGLSIEGPMPGPQIHIPPQQENAFTAHTLDSFDELLRAAQRHPQLGHGAQAAREVAEAARYAPPAHQQASRLPLSLPSLEPPSLSLSLSISTAPLAVPLASPTLVPAASSQPKKFDFNAAFKEHQRLSQLAREREQRQQQQPQPTGQSQLSPQTYTASMFQALSMSQPSPPLPDTPALPSPSISFHSFPTFPPAAISPTFGALPSPAPSLASFTTQPAHSVNPSAFASFGLAANSLGLSVGAAGAGDGLGSGSGGAGGGAGGGGGYARGVPSSLSLALPWAPDAVVAASQERALLEEYMKRCGAPVQVQGARKGEGGGAGGKREREKKGRARVEHIEHAAMYLPASG